MKECFKINVNEYDRITVEPNYDNGYRSKDEDPIMIAIDNDDEEGCVGLSISQTKELIDYLKEVIEYIEYAPKKGDWANIVGGKFNGFSGKIFDIDEVANIREAIIEIPKTLKNDKFYIYVSLCDLEVVRK
jgi:transcription antitermination factor NusG